MTSTNIGEEEYDYIFSEKQSPTLMVVWDLGRRCNFDCTYCTAWMHSTTAPFNEFEELKKTADFIDRYWKIYSRKHRNRNWKLKVSFTGGEPAINPAFFKLVEYLKENYPHFHLSLTTNGAWNERRGQWILDNIYNTTISYHMEGTEKQKELVRSNMLFMHEATKETPWRLKVNLMMHQDYWDESVDLIENFLKPNGIRFIPRVIGDDGKFRSRWFKDDDGAMRRTTHTYTEEQMDYLRSYWNAQNKKVDKQAPDLKSKGDNTGHARKMGRMCCGGRCMTVKRDNRQSDAMFIEQSNFEGYNCLINWFFLHIEQDRDAVYHHQTCMAKLEGAPDIPLPEDIQAKYPKLVGNPKIGPITSLSRGSEYLDWLESRFNEGKTPTMVCPNTHCGCGICIAKAKTKKDFEYIANHFIHYKADEN